MIPEKFPRLHAAALDWRVMLFALAISLATGVLFGLVPALEASSFSLADHLKQGSAGGGRRRGRRVSAALVISEVALCVVLMTGAGLLVRSFWKLTSRGPGLRPSQRARGAHLAAAAEQPEGRPLCHRGGARRLHARSAAPRCARLPGISFAAITTSLPTRAMAIAFRSRWKPAPRRRRNRIARRSSSVSPDYFPVLRTPLLEGRNFAGDRPARRAPRVVVVDRSTARRFWPGQSAVGKRIRLGRRALRTPRS